MITWDELNAEVRYHLAAFHLMQILENAMAIPDGLEPIPQVSPFFHAVYRHLHMVELTLKLVLLNFTS